MKTYCSEMGLRLRTKAKSKLMPRPSPPPSASVRASRRPLPRFTLHENARSAAAASSQRSGLQCRCVAELGKRSPELGIKIHEPPV